MSLSEQILQLPDALWKRLQAALGVKTRQAAADLVASDEKAASIATSILTPKTEGSLLTSKPKAKAPAAERMYGKSKGVTF